MPDPLMHYSTDEFMETMEVFCTVEEIWTTSHWELETGPSEPICDTCNTILTDELLDPAHHKIFDGEWFCKGLNVAFPEIPEYCPNCGEFVLADDDTVHGRTEEENTAAEPPDPETLPDGGGEEIDPATEPPPYEEP